jgi:hypothetical protein
LSAAERLLRAFATVETGEPDPSLITPDAKFDNTAEFLIQGPYHGVEGMRRWRADLLEVLDEGFRFETEIVSDEGPGVVAKHHLRGSFRSTGLPADLGWYTVSWERDERIFRGKGCSSYAEAMELSRTPAPE